MKMTTSAFRNKVVVVMGATGSGKSRLAIDLAAIFDGEVINSDKIQVYTGLDVITNKATDEELRGVPHHLIGIIDDLDQDFTADDFVQWTLVLSEEIVERGRLPIIAGGSNSFVQALVDNREFQSKYACCFFWLDASLPVLHCFVRKRVDQMVAEGLVDEARQVFGGDYSRGIRRAIGVPEMDEFFKKECSIDDDTKATLLKSAIDEIKENTCKLTLRQLEKIFMIAERMEWNGIHRLDATEVFLRRIDDAWQRMMVRPSVKILNEFLGSNVDQIDSKSVEDRAAGI